MSEIDKDAVAHAADLISQADALVIAAGAGMGVDSGLPDFRGNAGFWKAYPALAKAGLDFTRIASPRTFDTDPELGWGFYGHRLRLTGRLFLTPVFPSSSVGRKGCPLVPPSSRATSTVTSRSRALPNRRCSSATAPFTGFNAHDHVETTFGRQTR